jgi:hypothetical protein
LGPQIRILQGICRQMEEMAGRGSFSFAQKRRNKSAIPAGGALGISHANKAADMVKRLPKGLSAGRTKAAGAWVAALALLLAFCLPVHGGAPGGGGQSVALTWDPTTSANAAGYALYYGQDGTNFGNRIDVGTNTSFVVDGLQAGQTNYFAIVAYDAQGVESPKSNVLPYIVPGMLSVARNAGPGSAVVIAFPVASGHTYQVQASDNLRIWSTIWQVTATNNVWTQFQDIEIVNPRMRFYRLAWQ